MSEDCGQMTDDRRQKTENGPPKFGLPSRFSNRQSAIGIRQFGNALRAFTLIELLTVIAILGILASIAITVGRGVQERGKIARAKAEMAVLAAALEQYKAQYGDYPWTPDPEPGWLAVATVPDTEEAVILFNALVGNIGPTAGSAMPTRGRSFVELAKFTPWLTDDSHMPDPDVHTPPDLLDNWFEDPWGKWYYYVYKKGPSDTSWKTPGFLLYTHGPDRACNIGAAETSGFLSDVPGDSINADNIYFGRN